MQQLRIHAPGKVSLDEVPDLEPGPRDAVLQVRACGICGSDLGYIALGGIAGPAPQPTPLGHEFSAVVARVGSEVRRYRPGTRVVVNPMAAGNAIGNGGDAGAFGPEVLVREVDGGEVLFPIPDGLPFGIRHWRWIRSTREKCSVVNSCSLKALTAGNFRRKTA